MRGGALFNKAPFATKHHRLGDIISDAIFLKQMLLTRPGEKLFCYGPRLVFVFLRAVIATDKGISSRLQQLELLKGQRLLPSTDGRILHDAGSLNSIILAARSLCLLAMFSVV